MKTSLWIVVVLVAGFVGFLIGYSVSAHTGTRGSEAIRAAAQGPAAPAAAPSAGGYGATPAAAAGGYGEKPAVPAARGGASAERTADHKKAGPTAGY